MFRRRWVLSMPSGKRKPRRPSASLPEDHRLRALPEIEHKLQRLASIGPLPDVEVRIVDTEGAEVAPGEIGEIVVRTPRLMKGYVSQDHATAPTIVNGGFTRDMGWMDADGLPVSGGTKG